MFGLNVDNVFAEDKPLIDADLVNLRGLKHLDRLVLSGTKIPTPAWNICDTSPSCPISNCRERRSPMQDSFT